VSARTINFGDVQRGDKIAIQGVRVRVDHVEPHPEREDAVIVHYRGKDGTEHRTYRHRDLATELYSRPTESDPEDDGEKATEDPAAELEESYVDVVLAGSLTARYLEHPITFRYDSTQGFDTTIHAARLVGYSVNLKDVNLYLDNGEIHVPIKVTYDQVLTIRPNTPE